VAGEYLFETNRPFSGPTFLNEGSENELLALLNKVIIPISVPLLLFSARVHIEPRCEIVFLNWIRNKR